MQKESSVSFDTEALHSGCAFCQQSMIASYILKETPTFYVVTDHAPLTEGHILIVPKQHYTCYGAVPAELDIELLALKREVQGFFQQFYVSVVFWEHGVFRQTVFHAHLHCFPFGHLHTTMLDLCRMLSAEIVHSQDEIRAWYTSRGHYFYLADSQGEHTAFLFAPKMDVYLRIVQEVLWPGASARSGNRSWRSPEQRYEEGKSLIRATQEKWHQFQQQEVSYGNSSFS